LSQASLSSDLFNIIGEKASYETINFPENHPVIGCDIIPKGVHFLTVERMMKQLVAANPLAFC
jgi:hypothetical protein